MTFYGETFSEAFVNSDGNITFGAGDRASTSRSVGRFLAGAPRLAGFFADLDPSLGGRVFAVADGAGLTVTWCAVRGFDSIDTVTMQTTVQPDGTVPPAPRPERSANGLASQEADLLAATQRFYRTHSDIYDQLVFWGDSALIATSSSFAFEFTVANNVQGIGVPLFANAREFGSAGRLQSVVNMDRIAKYPASPTDKFLGENNVMSLLGQESGHRWLSFLESMDANRQRSRELLGREDAHWSFFFDSDASVMEGNDIDAPGGGAFRTVGAVQRYSRLDQYAMGLVSPDQVPPFFYVEAPVNVVPSRTAVSAPQVGVTFRALGATCS